MEMEKMSKMDSSARKDDDDDVPLPGFRFHPTDEELVGFYLRRKVEKRPVRIELITQVDIYKYDPWDLPKAGNVRDKEWYFFCKRGRKYRNSVRPNRVTGSGSGFWKATGIDRPIYSASSTGTGGGGEDRRECIGLKKSLVYYRGSAGKGTKTDWMMHEFRLPADHDDTNIAQEAEVWTLCRIFKRNVTYKKCIPDWRELYAAKTNPNPAVDASSKTCSVSQSDSHEGYISFGGAPVIRQNEKKNKQFVNDNAVDETKPMIGLSSSNTSQALPCPSTALTYSSFTSPVVVDANQLIKYDDWDELRSVVEFAVVDDPLFHYVNNNSNM